jgi:NAD(P)-dependent dehydrogenase (short-subunit alcohol dehydrogenase family)
MLRPIPQIAGGRAMAERTRILITGAASGIGAAIGRVLALPDTAIMLHTRRNRAGIESVAAELRLKDAQTALAVGDLADPGTADRLVAETVEQFGGLDVLISNAGFADRTPISSLSDAAMHASVEAIQGAFFRLARAATPHLCAGRNPRVVAVSSFVAHTFRPDIAVFPASAAAKAGLEALVRTLAIELAPSGVTVNAVVPGFIRKDAGAHRAVDPDVLAQQTARIPLGRIGSPEDVAAAVAFLVSPAANYMTGQILHVDGGLVI